MAVSSHRRRKWTVADASAHPEDHLIGYTRAAKLAHVSHATILDAIARRTLRSDSKLDGRGSVHMIRFGDLRTWVEDGCR